MGESSPKSIDDIQVPTANPFPEIVIETALDREFLGALRDPAEDIIVGDGGIHAQALRHCGRSQEQQADAGRYHV
jgi:hypothetical protein